MDVYGGWRARRCVLLGCVLLGLLGGAAPARAASAPSPDAAIDQLNAWRSMVGVPPVAHDASLSRQCRSHASYYRLNPTERGHREKPSLPGYSESGDRAARASVLAYEEAPTAGVAPWEPAPYHRLALLEPRLAASGFWSEFGLSCMQATALDATLRTPALTAYTYPVRGQRGVAPSFDCREIPNPCDAVPNNDGRTPTGFNISVQFNGPWATIAGVDVDSATVAAAGRPPVDVIVQTRERVLRGGIVLIPRRPLRYGTTYVAAVSGTVAGRAEDGTVTPHPFALSWDFSTPGVDPAASLRVTVERVTRSRVHVRLDLQSDEPREARISLLKHNMALVRVTRQITGPTQRISIARPRHRVTRVAVLLRGGPRHIGVAARLATDIKAVSKPSRVLTARARG
ncbi:MAG: CAP domain-containing protein [Solirubrobacteraceae bacterium]|nr:CAP domain-containing protein [Solirubrobacteraceae bacterium]